MVEVPRVRPHLVNVYRRATYSALATPVPSTAYEA
jgi:hypothetical protein